MKKLISISLLFLVACGPSKEELERRDEFKEDSIKASESLTKESNMIDISKNIEQINSFKVDLRGNKGFTLDYIIIDDHKYIILATISNNNISITHSGDCTNENHKNNNF